MALVKITNKPDGKGLTGHGQEVARTYLAEITVAGQVVDSAYFPTKAEAEAWALTVYNVG